MMHRLLLHTLLIFILAAPSVAFERHVLLENFTNVYDDACSDAEPLFRQLYEERANSITTIHYHTWWPAEQDQFYQFNRRQNDSRIEYYGVDAIPHVYIDGVIDNNPANVQQLGSALDARLALQSPVAIGIDYTGGDGEDIQVQITLTSGNQPVNGNIKLRVVLLERERDYAAPNGQQVWYDTFRDMLPSTAGEEIDMAANEVQEFEYDFYWDFEYDADNLKIVAFIQNDSGHEVLQAAEKNFEPDYSFEAVNLQAARLVQQAQDAIFKIDFANVGQLDDEYSIEVSPDFPEGWLFSYITPEGEFSQNSTFSLLSEEEFSILINVEPLSAVGVDGNLGFTITSVNRPQVTISFDFYTLITGDVLLVNSDPGGAYSEYYRAALQETRQFFRYRFATWNASEHILHIEDADSADVGLIVWFSGDGDEIPEVSLSGLSSYLRSGGSLFASGSEMPEILRDTDVLGLMGAGYHQATPNATTVEGLTGNDIGDGLNFSIQGGDGAGNRGVPSSLTAIDDGEFCFRYSLVRRAGVLSEGEFGQRTLLLGFPYEAINNEADRFTIMHRAVEYLTDFVGVPEVLENSEIAEVYHLGGNYPDPFNGSTVINFNLNRPAFVSLEVFDILGRSTDILMREQRVDGGNFRVNWLANEHPSGVYFYQLKVTTNDATSSDIRRMHLIR
ncbi:Omp28-related outer membrane protein [bacterium]|nr:Omp28-related outer membrane protein [bacterium]